MHRCLLVIPAVCLMTLMTNAQDKSGSTTDSKEIAEKNPIGYFLGISMGQQFLQQGLKAEDFDPEAFKVGVIDAISKKDLGMSVEQIQAAGQMLQDLMNNRHKEMLAKMNAAAEANLAKGKKWLDENKAKDGIKELAGGLQYKVLKEGKGGSPSASDTVSVHYTGKLTNGEVFDSSVKRGEPAKFMVGGVIKGWQMALQEMKVGDKWMLYIPPALAYGKDGSPGAIGPNEVLVFEVELLEIL